MSVVSQFTIVRMEGGVREGLSDWGGLESPEGFRLQDPGKNWNDAVDPFGNGDLLIDAADL
jgi:hypothetical protein